MSPLCALLFNYMELISDEHVARCLHTQKFKLRVMWRESKRRVNSRNRKTVVKGQSRVGK